MKVIKFMYNLMSRSLLTDIEITNQIRKRTSRKNIGIQTIKRYREFIAYV